MFSKIFSFFSAWFDKSLRLVQRLQAFGAWVWGVIAAILASLLWTLDFMTTRTNQLVLWLVSLIDTAAGVAGTATAGLTAHTAAQQMLEIANTFFPVSEMFMIAVSLTILQGVCSLYGLIKSWIPTVSG